MGVEQISTETIEHGYHAVAGEIAHGPPAEADDPIALYARQGSMLLWGERDKLTREQRDTFNANMLVVRAWMTEEDPAEVLMGAGVGFDPETLSSIVANALEWAVKRGMGGASRRTLPPPIIQETLPKDGVDPPSNTAPAEVSADEPPPQAPTDEENEAADKEKVDEEGKEESEENGESNEEEAAEDRELPSSTDTVRNYLKKIGKVALLSAAEEVELAKRIEAGVYATERLQLAKAAGEELSPQLRRDLKWLERDGKKAQEHLIEANLRLAVSLAKKWTGRGVAFLDLIQEANLGVIRAVHMFDYKKGYKFSTYATWWIRQYLRRVIAEHGRTIQLPLHVVESIKRMGSIRRELLQDLGREPTPKELADEMDMSLDKLLELQQNAKEPISFSMPVGDEGADLGDFIEDTDADIAADSAIQNARQQILEDVLSTLSEREEGVMRLRFGLSDGQPRTLEEIGKVYGVTRERIRQIETKTLCKLRHPSRSVRLYDFQ